MIIKSFICGFLFSATTLCLLTTTTYADSKKLKKAKAKISNLDSMYKVLELKYSFAKDTLEYYRLSYKNLQETNTDQKVRIAHMDDQIRSLQATNDQLLNRWKDLAVISNSQAESIKKSLDNIGSKDAYIRDLQAAISRKDSLNLALAMNLKGAIGNIDDKDINIKIEKGVVYVDISDKMLFKSGKYEVTSKAREVLGKVAKVLMARPEIEFMVEGHTDNVPFQAGVLNDNWDLSAKRATSVVRILQNEYGIPPARMTAAGRGEYKPLTDNDTDAGRAANRRTRIVILPQMDQFYELLEKQKAN